ncbi:MAG: ABC transporter ATP-binding protein [Candidatus Methanoplasma sp.]|jgi:iron complex transport system ATP-binding protein|nr:ABC transporter ATP-binding protein [Candidatus Methanoplasma sp.]
MQLRMEGVEFSYGSDPVLRNVGMELHPSEILGILGPNGSGKTTMVRCINGILSPQQGSITLDAKEIRSLPRPDVAKNISYVPHNSSNDTITPNVFEVVLMGRRPHVTWEFGERDREIAWNAMEEMDVKKFAATDFSKLSSGQAQRVLIARAIAQEAKVLLLDEPTSNLDVKYQIDVMETIHNIVHRRKIGACAIVHDLDLAMRFCDKVILLQSGRIVAAGPTRMVLTPENIKRVYEVNAVIDESYLRPRVLIL